MDSFFRQLSESGPKDVRVAKRHCIGPSRDPINRCVVYCPEEDLNAYPQTRLQTFLEGHGEIAGLHARFLLARKGDRQSIEYVKELVTYPRNGFVRCAAVAVLGLLPKGSAPEIVPILVKALRDPFEHSIGDVGFGGVGAEAALRRHGVKASFKEGDWRLEKLAEQ